MASPIPRSGCLAQSIDFKRSANDLTTSENVVNNTMLHDNDLIMEDLPQPFDSYVSQQAHGTFARIANNARTTIDLTGGDNIIEGSMNRVSFPTYREDSSSAETFRSAAREFNQTVAQNISLIAQDIDSPAGGNDSFIVQALHEMDIDLVHATHDHTGNPSHACAEADMQMANTAGHSALNSNDQTSHDMDFSMAYPTAGNTNDYPSPHSEVTVCSDDNRAIVEQEIIDLTDDLAHVHPGPSPSASESPGKPVFPPLSTLKPHKIAGDVSYVGKGGIVYQVGMCLEFRDGSFMKVTDIRPHLESNELLFHGWRLFRSSDKRLDTYVPKLTNELIWMTQLDDGVRPEKIKRIVNIRFTNHRSKFIEDAPILTCRLKLTMRQAGVIIMWGNAPLTADDNAIEYLDHNESDPGFGKWSNELRDEWRNTEAHFETVPFGEADKSSQALADERKGLIDLDPERAYTFGDAYCGGGGVSCGAKQAGVRIKWATDMNQNALDTYHLNYPGVETERSLFYDFLTNNKEFLRVDIAHCSPPCQTWSPAHTVVSAHDDANSACVFSGVDLAEATRCRILTIEETSGLLTRFVLHFNRIVLSLVELGYAVRWSVLGCDNYGVPQERKRVMIIAAGPGEALPHYPDPTHGLPGYGLNLMRRENIASTIGGIPDDAEDHDPDKALRRWEKSHREAFSENSLARTITCGGGEFNYHPSGTRAYTDREMALLQTFPMDYKFCGINTRKQIGNAVPPRFARVVYGEVLKSLRKTDQAECEGKFT